MDSQAIRYAKVPRGEHVDVGLLIIAVVVAMASLDTALTGKFHPLRDSDWGWEVTPRVRVACLVVGIVATVAAVLMFLRL